MSSGHLSHVSRRDLLHGVGVLIVYRDPLPPPKRAPGQPGVQSFFCPSEPELFIAVLEDGTIMAFNGHVDLGTGIRTALGQIVADELDVPFEKVHVVLGHPVEVPNQGPTIASATIQITAVPLRQAAAQARRFLVGLAAEQLGASKDELWVNDGIIARHDQPNVRVGYGELIAGRRFELTHDAEVTVKTAAEHRVVGRSVPRVDIPLKATGALTYVHDMRVPGMVHGRVIRPPYVGRDSGSFVGNSLLEVDYDSVADVPGLLKVVVIGDFVGVVAEREENAIQAAKLLKVEWKPCDDLVSMEDLETALRNNPAHRRPLREEGDVGAVLSSATLTLKRTYVWPYNMHGSIGPSCSVANYGQDSVKLWSGTQNPHSLRADMARLLDLDESVVEIVRMEASGCYGRNCADDVCADAALLSREIGRPVRVQLSRQQEHGWEPKGAAQLMDVSGSLDADGRATSYDFAVRYPTDNAPTLALLLTGGIEPVPEVLEIGDRTAVPPYSYPNMRIACDDTPTIVRASWLRGVSALPNSFAHDSFIDELAYEAGADPVEFRLRHLTEPRPRELIEALAERAHWEPRPAGAGTRTEDGRLWGRGFAYAQYVHSKFPGFGAAMAAWVVELEVDPVTGQINVRRAVVGQDAGLMINPAGVRHQLHGNVIQSLSRVLKESVTFDRNGVTSLEWGGYPILTFPELPEIDVMLMDRPNEPPLGAGESASVPSAAAVANALYDATGVRFRQPPFTPAVVQAALREC